MRWNPKPALRPLRIAHWFEYDAGLNDEEAAAYVSRRIAGLKSRGYAGAVVNVPWGGGYLTDGKAWRIFERTIALLREAGMRAWIYDEDGYPSGSAGALVLEGHPEYEARGVVCLTRRALISEHVYIPKPNGHDEVLAAFAVPDGPLTRAAIRARVDLSAFVDGAGALTWDADSCCRIFVLVGKPVFEGSHAARNYYSIRRFPDLTNEEAVKRFLDCAYEAYYSHAGEEFGKTVEAIFTDEPSLMSFYTKPLTIEYKVVDRPRADMPLYPFVAWPHRLRARFEARFGYDPTPFLPFLFEGDGDEAREFRCSYYEILADAYERAYFRQLADFCGARGVAFTGHILFEESIDVQALCECDFFRMLRHMDIPGVDNLTVSCPDIVRDCFGFKTVASVARAYGRDAVMTEHSGFYESKQGRAFGRAEVLCSTAIQWAFGVTRMTSYFKESELSEKDCRVWSDFTARLTEAMTYGENAAPVAVYYPIHTMWASLTPSATDIQHWQVDCENPDAALSASPSRKKCVCALGNAALRLIRGQVDFDLVNDEVLRDAAAREGQLESRLGKRYSLLYVPYAREFSPDALEALCRLAREGVPIAVEETQEGAHPIWCQDKARGAALYDEMLARPNVALVRGPEQLAALADGVRDILIEPPNPNVVYQRRCGAGVDIYLLVNSDQAPAEFTVSFRGAGQVRVCDPETGVCRDAQTLPGGESPLPLRAKMRLNGYQALVLCAGTDLSPFASHPAPQR